MAIVLVADLVVGIAGLQSPQAFVDIHVVAMPLTIESAVKATISAVRKSAAKVRLNFVCERGEKGTVTSCDSA